MNYSSTYVALEEMIKKSWVTDDLSEINEVLEQYERDGRIKVGEYRCLLELYIISQKTGKRPGVTAVTIL